VTAIAQAPSPRRDELLERAYRYVLQHGLGGMSLRPLAAAVGSSPRVLLFLFGSKDDLVRELLARARQDELALLDAVRPDGAGRDRSQHDLAEAAAQTWQWLAAPEHRALLRLWVEGYARSLVEPAGPWRGFAEATVADWLTVLEEHQPVTTRRTPSGVAQRTLVLAVLRGALLDLLATGDADRTSAAVASQLAAWSATPG
jgi:AcrR family transcriptional regulator